MKVELGYTMREGCWKECTLCGEGFRADDVEAHIILLGGYYMRPVCRQYALTGEQGLRQRLIFRAWAASPADRLEQACEEGLGVPSLYDLQSLERRRRAGRAPVDPLDLGLEES